MSKRSEELRAKLQRLSEQENWEADESSNFIDYTAANGHLMTYYESKANPGQPSQACVWRAWHSPNCMCGKALLD